MVEVDNHAGRQTNKQVDFKIQKKIKIKQKKERECAMQRRQQRLSDFQTIWIQRNKHRIRIRIRIRIIFEPTQKLDGTAVMLFLRSYICDSEFWRRLDKPLSRPLLLFGFGSSSSSSGSRSSSSSSSRSRRRSTNGGCWFCFHLAFSIDGVGYCCLPFFARDDIVVVLADGIATTGSILFHGNRFDSFRFDSWCKSVCFANVLITVYSFFLVIEEPNRTMFDLRWYVVNDSPYYCIVSRLKGRTNKVRKNNNTIQ